jgi:hypothetical protein
MATSTVFAAAELYFDLVCGKWPLVPTVSSYLGGECLELFWSRPTRFHVMPSPVHCRNACFADDVRFAALISRSHNNHRTESTPHSRSFLSVQSPVLNTCSFCSNSYHYGGSHQEGERTRIEQKQRCESHTHILSILVRWERELFCDFLYASIGSR